eukprot:450142-Pleurochrysis_carterae.AAC.1
MTSTLRARRCAVSCHTAQALPNRRAAATRPSAAVACARSACACSSAQHGEMRARGAAPCASSHIIHTRPKHSCRED